MRNACFARPSAAYMTTIAAASHAGFGAGELNYTLVNMKSRSSRWLALSIAAALSASGLLAQTAPKVTSPRDALGFKIGDDYQVANYTQLEAYWKTLASESGRMKLVSIGQTAEGRQQYRSEERRVGKECRSRWSTYH